MPNRSYQKGYRFEKKCQAWLTHLGECIRSAMSKGDDLTLTRNLRRWTFSCKVREKSICKLIDTELETHDAFIWQQDRGVPIVAMPLPKLVEFIAGDRGGNEAGAVLETAKGYPSSQDSATLSARAKTPEGGDLVLDPVTDEWRKP